MRLVIRGAVVLVAATTLAAVVPASAAPDGKTFQAPFKVGTSGGDTWSLHTASANGSVTVGRVYPIPGAINCTKGGPFAMLYVPFKATGPVRKVVVSYDSAAVDNFTFVLVSLRDDANHWYGTKSLRGLVSGSGTVTLKPDMPQGHFPRSLRVQFGLQQSSACPNADAGTLTFTKVKVFS